MSVESGVLLVPVEVESGEAFDGEMFVVKSRKERLVLFIVTIKEDVSREKSSVSLPSKLCRSIVDLLL